MAERRVSARQRSTVQERAGGLCEYCRSPARIATGTFAVEHVLPRSRGGKTRLENLALACPACNNHKYNKIEAVDPVTDSTVPLFNPRREVWTDHFEWSDGYTCIVGLTPTGRATVEVLHLNRPESVALRRLLIDRAAHPFVDPTTQP